METEIPRTCSNKTCSEHNVVYYHYRYCSKCGQELVPLSKCERCEYYILPRFNFCPECGRPTK